MDIKLMNESPEIAKPNDISENPQNNDVLNSAEGLYQALFEHAQDPILIFSIEEASFGKMISCNSAAAKLHGYTIDEMKSLHIRDIAPQQSQAHFSKVLAQSMEGQWVNTEFILSRKDGSTFPIEVNAGIITFDNMKCAVGIGRDMTLRQQNELLAIQTERFNAVIDIAAGIAHNFNNILQIILGNAELTYNRLESETTISLKKYLDRIIKSARLGAATVQKLTNLTRFHEDNALSSAAIIDFSEIVRQAYDLASTWWTTVPEKKGGKVDVVLDLGEGCLVRGHKADLMEVMVNLIKNAAEAIEQNGSIIITTDIEDSVVIITVQDNGHGISEEHQKKIFTPFFTTKLELGTGLGLVATKTIVENYGGQIFLHSIENKGTTFTIKLPLADSDY